LYRYTEVGGAKGAVAANAAMLEYQQGLVGGFNGGGGGGGGGGGFPGQSLGGALHVKSS
jgi:hypothetical protein